MSTSRRLTAGSRASSDRVSPSDDKVETVIGGRFQARSFSFDANGTSMAFLRTDDVHPAEVFVSASDGKNARQLTNHNGAILAGLALQGAEEFWFDSFDGTRVQGWVMKPVGAEPGKKYPTILTIHGGPHSSAFGFNWIELHQLLTGSGYGVVFINPRGSVGYGQSFADGSVLNWGGGDYKDLMHGLDAAIEQNAWIDTTRLGVTGGSYGGFMTNWVITQTRRFKAAVATASLSNLISFYGTSLYTDLVEAEFNQRPWDIIRCSGSGLRWPTWSTRLRRRCSSMANRITTCRSPRPRGCTRRCASLASMQRWHGIRVRATDSTARSSSWIRTSGCSTGSISIYEAWGSPNDPALNAPS